MNRTRPTRSLPFPFLSLSHFFLISFFVMLPGLAHSYTAEDIDKAKGDVTQLKQIIEDKATENYLRTVALQSLPSEEVAAYFNTLSIKPIPAFKLWFSRLL